MWQRRMHESGVCIGLLWRRGHEFGRYHQRHRCWVNWWCRLFRVELVQTQPPPCILNGLPTTLVAHVSRSKQLWKVAEIITLMTSPQINGMAERFVQNLKRDYTKLANSPDSKTVMSQLQVWFDDYNSYRQHIALGYLPPTRFKEKQSVT